MAYYPYNKSATATSDFVVDFLSPPTNQPPIVPSRQPTTSSNPAYIYRRQKPEVVSAGRVRQALPPSDDDRLVVKRDSVESFETFESGTGNSGTGMFHNASSSLRSEGSSQSLTRAVMPPAEDFTFIPPEPKLLSSCDELLLASVPYHTLRIEPSPSMTLDHKKSSRRSRGSEIEGHIYGRLKSTGSFDNDLESLRDPTEHVEPVRSSSTPHLAAENFDDTDQGAFYSEASQFQFAAERSMVQKLNMFFGESKETATELEANIYKSLVLGPLPSVSVSSTTKSKKSASAWSLASKFAGSHVSLAGKHKKSSDDKVTESLSQSGFQKTKERRSLRGRMADLVRQRMAALSSNSGDGPAGPEGPKTFGIPLEQCYMSHNYEGVPVVVDVCVKIIQEHGLTSQGIYRVPGNASVVHELQDKFDKTPLLNIENNESWQDVNVMASLLKLFFRKLPESLLSPELYERLIESNRLEKHEDRLICLKEIIDELADFNYMTLRFLMEHLNSVASEHASNKMDAYNLSIMFGPALVRPKDDTMVNMLRDMADQGQIVENLIKYCEWFFDSSQRELSSIPADPKADSTSPHLLPSTEHLVELQIARDTQAREMIANFEQFQAANASAASSSSKPKKTRKRSKSGREHDDIEGSKQDLTREGGELGAHEVKTKIKPVKSSSNLEGYGASLSSKPTTSFGKKIQQALGVGDESVTTSEFEFVPASSSANRRRQLASAGDEADAGVETFVEVVRYPARRFDTNTFYVGSGRADKDSLSSLPQKNSAKSASAECLDAASLDSKESDLALFQHASTLQIKPKVRPPVPPKPKSNGMLAEVEKSPTGGVENKLIGDIDSQRNRLGDQSIGTGGSVDSKFKEQLSCAIKQRCVDMEKNSKNK